MADTIYLSRGQTLNVTAVFRDAAGVQIVIDDTYTVTSSMKAVNGCKDPFVLSPTLSDGSVIIAYSTALLTEARYVFDIIAKPATGTREVTAKIYLQLEQPVTPLT
jgi:hypothetical protein